MYCTSCGTKIPDNSRFCTSCGNPVKRKEGPQAAATPSPSPQPAAQPEAKAATQPKTPTIKKPAIIAAAACAVAAAAIAGVMVVSSGPVTIDERSFPDQAVRTYVQTHADTNGDNKLSADEIKGCTVVKLDGATNLTGLDRFGNIVTLQVSGDAESLDLSKVQCVSLDVSGMQNLSNLNLGKQTNLTNINACNCPSLKEVDISGCSKAQNVQVDDTTQIDGMERTGLVEYWVPESISLTYGSTTISRLNATYDQQGNVSEYTVGTFQGGAVAHSVTYDSQEHITSFTTGTGSSSMQTVTTDDKGRVKTVTRGNETMTYTYDEGGHITSATITHNSGTMKYEYAYDTAGNITSRSLNGSKEATWEYDASGKLIREWSHTGNGSYEQTKEYTYDASGNIVKAAVQKLVVANGKSSVDSTYEITYNYGQNGKVSSAQSTLGDTLICTYDENGNLTNAKISQGSKSSNTYVPSEAKQTFKRVLASASEDAPFAPSSLQIDFGSTTFFEDSGKTYLDGYSTIGNTPESTTPHCRIAEKTEATAPATAAATVAPASKENIQSFLDDSRDGVVVSQSHRSIFNSLTPDAQMVIAGSTAKSRKVATSDKSHYSASANAMSSELKSLFGTDEASNNGFSEQQYVEKTSSGSYSIVMGDWGQSVPKAVIDSTQDTANGTECTVSYVFYNTATKTMDDSAYCKIKYTFVADGASPYKIRVTSCTLV